MVGQNLKMEYTIQHKNEKPAGKFCININNKELAVMDYHYSNNNDIVITHTGVDESLKGLGIGKALLTEAIHFCIANQLKIVPVCPFVKSLMEKNSEWTNLIA